MSKGRVYWITGLSNSGKTTVGTALYYELKKIRDNVVILDGDIMKEITSVSISEEYSPEGRFARAKRYSSLSKLLSDQGLTVIVCTISMYDEIRNWNRLNIKGYIEIFLDCPEAVLMSRDKKGLYQSAMNVEYPKSPDIRIVNDGRIPLREIIKLILSHSSNNEDDYDRDRGYWNQYYANIPGETLQPSQFCMDISDDLEPGKHLLELGCGNGRDSLIFLKKGLRVTAIDASDVAIDHLNKLTKETDAALFVCDDFVKCVSLYQLKYDYVYSRFTLHAINDEQETELLENVHSALTENGKFFIEARSIRDDLYGQGKKVGENAFIYDGHYRRFIDPNQFKQKLERLGFKVNMLVESAGLSKTEESDPVLLRCI